MRIVKTDTVAGLPAPAARGFLRRVRVTEFDEEWALSLLETLGATDPKSTLGPARERVPRRKYEATSVLSAPGLSVPQ